MSDVEYHRVLAGEHRRIGRGLLAIVLLIAGSLLFSVVAAVVANAIDERGRDGAYTPLLHGLGMFSVALLIPWSMFLQRWLYGVRGASLHSVVSRFRFDLFGRALLLVLPAMVAVLVVGDYLAPEPDGVWTRTDALWMLVAVLVVMPFQAAGEEYGFRGLIFRIAGSWTRGSRSGLIAGLAVTFVTFAVSHAATSPWLNIWYVIFATGAALITWRTGGLEVAIVLHALYNTLGYVFLVALRTDPSIVTNRGADAAVGAAVTLLPGVVVIVATAVVWYATRRTGPLRTPAVVEEAKVPAREATVV